MSIWHEVPLMIEPPEPTTSRAVGFVLEGFRTIMFEVVRSPWMMSARCILPISRPTATSISSAGSAEGAQRSRLKSWEGTAGRTFAES